MNTAIGRACAGGLLCAILSSAVLGAPWAVREPENDTEPLRAVQNNERGDEISVFRDPLGAVYLEFRTVPGFRGLVRTSCPTFQIDDRLPLHQFEIDRSCRVDNGSATYGLGQVQEDALISLVTHRLMNGVRVAFRYLTQDGTYHESTFALTNSKRAVQRALGNGTQVDPE